jgi:dolichol-phosphate mannosyltransferase
MFGMVGATGIAVHLGALYVLYRSLHWYFPYGQLAATFIAMTYNFILNNIFTYSDRRLSGAAFIIGLFSFYFVCSFGTLANVSVATLLYGLHPGTPLLAGLAGAIMSVVFNYAASRVLTWRDV